MSQNRGPKRLAFFIIFLIPVGWYLFIQLFGDNNFEVKLQSPIDDCESFEEIMVITRNDSLTVAQTNYMNRVTFGCDKRKINLQKRSEDFFECVNQSEADLVLVSDEGMWGNYELSRAGVDQLLTEIDILMIQKSYGKGTKR